MKNMKKISLYVLLGFITAIIASCRGNEYEDWADPQAYQQEDGVTIPGFTATASSAIDLNSVETETVNAFSLSTATLPDGYSIENVRVELTPADDAEATATTMETTTDGELSVSELQSLVESCYGKRPVARTFKAHVYANAVKDGQAVLIDAGTVNVVITPQAPFIDTAYYLVGDMLSWDATGMAKFDHSDSDVYDDPVFSVTFTTTADNQYWQIIPQTNVDGSFWDKGKTGVVGVAVNGDTSMSGSLTTDSPNAGKIEKAGTYVMTINMMDYTYTIQGISRYYMVGGLPGWDAEGAITALFYPQSGTVMSYTTKWPGAWDLKIWSESTIGNWDVAYGTAVDGDGSESGSLINSGAQSFQAPTQNEYYTLTINMGNMTYTWTKLDNQNPDSYTTIGLIGDFNGWGGDVAMTEVTPHNWYVETEIASTGGLKFRADNAWNVNWGASLSVSTADYYATAVNNGDNITVPAGKYRIYLNDITGECAFVAVE